MSTCFDCKQKFPADSLHLIKAPTLNGRAWQCEPCHIAEVKRIREFNRSIHNTSKGWQTMSEIIRQAMQDATDNGASKTEDYAQAVREALLSDETVERVARAQQKVLDRSALIADVDLPEYLARAALTAALGIEGEK